MASMSRRRIDHGSSGTDDDDVDAGGGVGAGAGKTRLNQDKKRGKDKEREREKDAEKHPAPKPSHVVLIAADSPPPCIPAPVPPGLSLPTTRRGSHSGSGAGSGPGSGTGTPTRAASAAARVLDRWLSSETWCDVLFLPKPWLRVQSDAYAYAPGATGNGNGKEGEKEGEFVFPKSRPVSPPGGVVWCWRRGRSITKRRRRTRPNRSLESRVLAHARSVADFRPPTAEGDVGGPLQLYLGHSLGLGVGAGGASTLGAGCRRGCGWRRRRAGKARRGMLGVWLVLVPAVVVLALVRRQEAEWGLLAVRLLRLVVVLEGGAGVGKPPRPKSFALDDLALLSPVPSLTRYVHTFLFFFAPGILTRTIPHFTSNLTHIQYYTKINHTLHKINHTLFKPNSPPPHDSVLAEGEILASPSNAAPPEDVSKYVKQRP
ncbi:hypothetical protein HGRIS_001491 [Hohenbuehelia grisea]|uniref:Uncharacterized protein n=1 Tax=Hohenbuehelia grisea TaxID=104357 RepID=A0ABR3JQ90_9AGAR